MPKLQKVLNISLKHFFFIESIAHFDKNLQSPGTILSVCQRINQQKSDQKLIRYKNINFEYYLLLDFFYCKIIFAGWWNIQIISQNKKVSIEDAKLNKMSILILGRITTFCWNYNRQKQPPRGAHKKRCSEKICSKLCMQSSFIEIALRCGCSPTNFLHIFRTPFPRNTSEWLLLNRNIFYIIKWVFIKEKDIWKVAGFFTYSHQYFKVCWRVLVFHLKKLGQWYRDCFDSTAIADRIQSILKDMLTFMKLKVTSS